MLKRIPRDVLAEYYPRDSRAAQKETGADQVTSNGDDGGDDDGDGDDGDGGDDDDDDDSDGDDDDGGDDDNDDGDDDGDGDFFFIKVICSISRCACE